MAARDQVRRASGDFTPAGSDGQVRFQVRLQAAGGGPRLRLRISASSATLSTATRPPLAVLLCGAAVLAAYVMPTAVR